jgi:hypothetical protein
MEEMRFFGKRALQNAHADHESTAGAGDQRGYRWKEKLFSEQGASSTPVISAMGKRNCATS